jgi:hypothetical protein
VGRRYSSLAKVKYSVPSSTPSLTGSGLPSSFRMIAKVFVWTVPSAKVSLTRAPFSIA